MDAYNPYGTPTSSAPATPPAISPTASVSAEVIEQLAGTKPWVILLSVLTFIGAALMLLGALGMFFLGGLATTLATPSNQGASGGAMVGAAGVFYLILAGLYIYPGIKLWKYGSKIGRLLSTRTEFDLALALKEQRAFWKFTAIAVIAIMVLTIVAMLVSAVLGLGNVPRA